MIEKTIIICDETAAHSFLYLHREIVKCLLIGAAMQEAQIAFLSKLKQTIRHH